MKTFFKELLEYSHHYNQRLVQLFLSHQDAISDRSLQLMNHLVNAQHIWNCRIMETEPKMGVWHLHPLDDLAKVDTENFALAVNIVEQRNLETVIAYINTKGDHYSHSIRDILFHVINHSTHHRAQISSDLKINKVDPIPMDFIFYKR